ncbi:metal-dependent hydrolase [Actinosynnema mirum]|uniref:Membrane-bound metal-dependent hydrolase n=1 Tax=Actinosynnema mirum (strain ATCC 29888 / DSM 43827 / JCM 3225 / NBRC 14064 / NCIMB 13271 / NRRL B-12336 / IMRU 3971 / 101) TaxID=446462 RepID=C6WBB7_ACTMD|nr:metal-dependent hydrolase [Actinosynnema mirum]ACU39408.1 membrane-bound metal-dependent hydrolase [Actinosynnema mirum DSM 43827]
MMGRTHALTGLCAGLALAPLTATTTAQAVVLALVTAGFALVPDLDHPGARASRLLGPVTGLLSQALRAGSRWLYARTRGPRDERHRGEHRHATHTLVFAVLVGIGVGAGSAAWGTPFVVGTVLLGIALAGDALGDWVLPLAGIAGIALWGTSGGDLPGDLAGIGWPLGIAAGTGCLVHCLGDALTLSGCPVLWPIPIAGETWYEIRPPRPLRFRTGGPVEQRLVFPAFVVLAVLLSLGVPVA